MGGSCRGRRWLFKKGYPSLALGNFLLTGFSITGRRNMPRYLYQANAVSRGFAVRLRLAGPGQSPGLAPSLVPPGPETDMRSPPAPGLWVLNAAASFADAPLGHPEAQRAGICRTKQAFEPRHSRDLSAWPPFSDVRGGRGASGLIPPWRTTRAVECRSGVMYPEPAGRFWAPRYSRSPP